MRYRRIHAVGLLTAFTVLFSGSISEAASHNLNNELDTIDYKVSAERFQNDSALAGDEADVQDSEPRRDTDSIQDGADDVYSVAAKSWLIEHGIVDRPIALELNNGFKAAYDDSWFNDKATAKKSDVYTMLYRMQFGTEEGNTLIFSAGDDSYYYYSSGVYEKYLLALLDKGLILKSELQSDNQFVAEYSMIGDAARPLWYDNDLVRVEATTVPGLLGSTYEYTISGLKRIAPDFFDEEEMLMIDAFSSIERFMRLTEKDMTEAEASIISYKYGINYLSGLSEDERSTISFLIAKGVINFEEDPVNLYESATYGKLWPFLYRVAKEDARYDFSKIQLTDSEAFWQQKGFSADNFYLEKLGGFYYDSSIVEVEPEGIAGVINRIFSVNATSNKQKFSITKRFDKVNVFVYGEHTVGEIAEMEDSVRQSQYPEIKEYRSIVLADGSSCHEFIIEVQSSSQTRAARVIDAKIRCSTNARRVLVNGVTKVSAESAKDITLISKDAVRVNYPNIEFISDNVMLDTESGSMACFIPEQSYALIGNQVITSETVMVDTEYGAYYNLDVISSLVGANGYKDIILSTGMPAYGGFIEYVSSRAVSASDRHGDLGTTECLTFITGNGGSEGDDILMDNRKTAVNGELLRHTQLYNVNQLSNGVSSLYRVLYADTNGDGLSERMVVLLDLVYRVPSLDDFNQNDWMDKHYNNANLTLNGVFSALYTQPAKGSELRKWWDSNYGMANAMANLIFGTKRVEYVKCGYVMPVVTVLFDTNTPAELRTKATASSVMISNGFEMSSGYGEWIRGTTGDFLTSYYTNVAGLSPGSVAYEFAKVHRTCSLYGGYGIGTGNSSVTVDGQFPTDGSILQSNGEKPANWQGDLGFGKDFCLTRSNVLYRSAESDMRVSFGVNNNLVDTISVTEGTTYNFVTTAPTGSVVSYGGYDWFYHSDVTINGVNCLRLIPVDVKEWPLRVYVKHANGRNVVVDKPFSQTIAGLYSKFGLTGDKVPTDAYTMNLNGLEVFMEGINQKLSDAGIITLDVKGNKALHRYWGVYNGSLGGYQYDGKSIISPASFKKKTDIVKGDMVVVPSVYLPIGSYYTYKSGDGYKLGTGSVAGALNFANFSYSGMVNSIIDSIISKELNTTSISSLKDGMRVKIGGDWWTADGGTFISDTIYDTNLVEQSKNLGSFSGLHDRWKAYAISCDGLTRSLKNYLRDATLSDNASGLKDGDWCYMLDSNGVKCVRKGSEIYDVSYNANCTRIRAALDDSLLVRPVNAEGTHYIMVYNATESIVNGIDFPFYTGNVISSQGKERAYFDLNHSSYEMSSEYNYSREEFEKGFQKRWYQDFWTLIKMFIIVACSYLSVMGWIAYLVVTMGYGASFLEAIAGKKNGGNGNGIDFVKIFTIGVYSLDERPSAPRVAIVSIVCFCIIGVCLSIL